MIRQAGNLPAALPGAGHDFGNMDLSTLFGIDLEEMTMPDLGSGSAEKATKKTTERTTDQDSASTITSHQLAARGIPAYMRQNWLVASVLLRTEQRAVYKLTDRTGHSITRYLDQKK